MSAKACFNDYGKFPALNHYIFYFAASRILQLFITSNSTSTSPTTYTEHLIDDEGNEFDITLSTNEAEELFGLLSEAYKEANAANDNTVVSKKRDEEVCQPESLRVASRLWLEVLQNPSDQMLSKELTEAMKHLPVEDAPSFIKTQLMKLLKIINLDEELHEEIESYELSSTDYNDAQLVVPGVYVGSFRPSLDKTYLNKLGISHIVSCIGSPQSFSDLFKYHTFFVEDTPMGKIVDEFPGAVDFVKTALAGGGRVLIHCAAGISRAPTVCAAFLIYEILVRASTALQIVKAARPFANPNKGFRLQLRTWERSVRENKERSMGGNSILNAENSDSLDSNEDTT